MLVSLPAFGLAQDIAIAGYQVPVGGASEAITLGPDGAMWFTDVTGYIGRITEAGVITLYPVPGGFNQFYGIATGPDGAVWFTGASGYVGRITTAGAVTEYSVPNSDAYPYGITAGPDGALWFTELYANQIGRITTSGAITEYPVPNPGGGIAVGPDGALWFTTTYAIGRITTTGSTTEYPVSTAPTSIASGPDGALWFTAYGSIGRITTGGAVSEYPLYPYEPAFGIVAIAGDALWFADNGDYIGRITTDGVITHYSPAGFELTYGGIAAGPHGGVWFTGRGSTVEGCRIGQVIYRAANLAVSPPTGAFRSQLSFTASGFWAYENVRIYSDGFGSPVIASATADASGSFTVTARAPASPFGPRIFLSLGEGSGKVGAANFSMMPRLVLTPSSGPPGTSVTAQGYGGDTGESVEIYWNNPRTYLGAATADTNGAFAGTAALPFTVPAASPLGPDGVFAQVGGTLATGYFRVE